MTQWDFQNKGTLTSPAWLSFVLKVPLRHLRPSVIYSVPCDWILQMVYSEQSFIYTPFSDLHGMPHSIRKFALFNIEGIENIVSYLQISCLQIGVVALKLKASLS